MEIWLRLFYSLSLIWIRYLTVVHSEDVGVVIGGRAELPCYVDVDGQTNVAWFDPGGRRLTYNEDMETSDPRFELDRPYYKEWNLIINGVHAQDEGTYNCKVYTSPEANNLVNLVILHPPTIDHSSGDVFPVTGDDVILECRASGVPDPTVTWYKYTNSGDKESLNHEGETYSLKNVSRHDSGTYECTAENSVPPVVFAQMNVDVKFPPFVDLPYEELTQQLGKDALLQCLITANPHVTMYWEKDGVKLEPSSKYDIMVWEVQEHTKNLAVKVISLELGDFGEYKCVAENPHGSDQASMHLYETHTGNLRVLAKPKDVISQSGVNVLFNCTVEGITQTDSLTWWHFHPLTGYHKIFVSNPSQNDVPFFDDDKYEIKGHYDLFIRSVDDGDFGEYICDITSHENYTAFLTLVETPECTVNRTQVNANGTAVNEGEPAQLTCSLNFFGGDPNWQVDWQHGERKLSSVNLDETGILIREVQFRATLEDAGLYECQISTREPSYFGSCSAEIDVIKIGPTPAPICPGSSVSTISSPAFWIILGFSIFALCVIFGATIIAVTGYYRKKLQETRQANSQDARYKNGKVSLEMEGLTAEPHEVEV